MRGPSPAAASGGHSSSRCAGLSPSRPLLLRSTGSRRTSSAIVAHGPSRSAACGIFPDQGSNPCPLHWQADSQPLRHQGSPQNTIINDVLTISQKLFGGIKKKWRWSESAHSPTGLILFLRAEKRITENCHFSWVFCRGLDMRENIAPVGHCKQFSMAIVQSAYESMMENQSGNQGNVQIMKNLCKYSGHTSHFSQDLILIITKVMSSNSSFHSKRWDKCYVHSTYKL